ncbi:hypothetical protein UFOVP611_22 [uncultured Caudovirales phage]|uniref:Uncharacterized protein n=1 Tax=uncultured Caudovirales phage TaxID=2100421 RepID=A0A6J5N1L6_9CAUD|nr:hypothetical protein UFOVP611_22 [uncultured Caudovirales phage]
MNKKEKREKVKRILLQVLTTLTTLPLMLTVFTIDRTILIFLPHIHGRNFKNWLESNDSVVQSILRIIAVSGVYGLIELCKWIY